jgi:circadian clock protein KaiC
VELDSQLRKMLAIVRMRRSEHSRELREITITSQGLQVLGAFRKHEALLTGIARQKRSAGALAGYAQHLVGAGLSKLGLRRPSWLRR